MSSLQLVAGFDGNLQDFYDYGSGAAICDLAP
jgi:hypothetical protein